MVQFFWWYADITIATNDILTSWTVENIDLPVDVTIATKDTLANSDRHEFINGDTLERNKGIKSYLEMVEIHD